jgi:hypothetical protein
MTAKLHRGSTPQRMQGMAIGEKIVLRGPLFQRQRYIAVNDQGEPKKVVRAYGCTFEVENRRGCLVMTRQA